jgi:glutathione synthase/RimK-type ligase-like ATP-grasp enzyme
LVNWGAGSIPARVGRDNLTILNPAEAVSLSGNKLRSFERFAEFPNVRIPQWTTSQEEARSIIQEGGVIVCRTQLRGHSGEGIVLAETVEQLVDAPLYVKYIKKQKEFRVHVGSGEVLDIQEKRRRQDYEGDANFKVRNHHTGWVYCRENIEEPADLRQQALEAIAALGLDFGAVDLIYNARQNQSYVLEVNTAPGLEGTTLEVYSNYLFQKANRND